MLLSFSWNWAASQRWYPTVVWWCTLTKGSSNQSQSRIPKSSFKRSQSTLLPWTWTRLGQLVKGPGKSGILYASGRNKKITCATLRKTSSLDAAGRQPDITERAQGLFHDTDTLPTQRSLYYPGVFFQSGSDFMANEDSTSSLSNNWHTPSIRLAARKCDGKLTTTLYRNQPQKKSLCPRISILETILPPYPSLNISFH